MAAKRTKTRGATVKRNVWDTTFSDTKLTGPDKAEFLRWLQEENPDPHEQLFAMVEHEYKVGLKYDSENDCYTSTIIAQDFNSPHLSVVVMSRAGTMDEALLMGAYKVGILYAGKALPTREDGNQFG
jgi:hypothetical protein